jgi:hypothetical protein
MGQTKVLRGVPERPLTGRRLYLRQRHGSPINVFSLQDQQIEDKEVERRHTRAVSLQGIEGGPSSLTERDDFTVDHGFIGHRCEGFGYAGISQRETVIVERR